MSYLRVNTVPSNTINMAIVNNGEVVWSHKHTIQFRKMINIGKKLTKITVEHNSTRFIVRLRGTEICKHSRLRIFPHHLSNTLKYKEKPSNIILLHFISDEDI